MRIVVITGGTAGVGRATARRFARDGDAIALLARGRDGLAATAAEIERLGGRALAIPTDVADAAQVDAAAARIERELGPVDVWINNAMTTVFGPVSAIPADEIRRVVDVTFLGYVWGTQAALRSMRPRGRGTIVQVGSALAYRGIPLQSAYCASKHAIRGFTDSLRSELRHEGLDVHLTMVQLPALNTPQHRWCENKLDCAPQPVPPIFQPEVAAEAIHFAATHRRREIFVGMPTIEAILGQKVAPGLLDRYLARTGYDAQCSNLPRPPHHRSNLFAPIPGDGGAHGDFDDRSRAHDPVATVGTWLGAAGIQAIAAALVLGVVAALGAAAARLAPRRPSTIAYAG